MVLPNRIRRFALTLSNGSRSCGFSTRREKRRFIDWKKIRVSAGNGGNGCVSFRREANIRYGGPDGGDGGAGGSVVFAASRTVKSLALLRKSYTAESGGKGMGENCHGKSGKDVCVQVPIGTVVTDWESKGVIADLGKEDSTCVVVKGGNGGLGNTHFAGPTNQRPRECTLGETGESLLVEVIMKTIADIGLVGYPNAGKSTLLRALSRAKPAVAAYPFTTLRPHVGVVEYSDGVQIAVADIPGLIPGAHKNVGLGHSFLRHIERCRNLLFVVDLDSPDPPEQVAQLKYELNMYQSSLGERPGAIVANKMDMEDVSDSVRELTRKTQLPVVPVSALHKWNIKPLKNLLYQLHKSHLQLQELST